jgi:hypothetical protein
MSDIIPSILMDKNSRYWKGFRFRYLHLLLLMEVSYILQFELNELSF